MRSLVRTALVTSILGVGVAACSGSADSEAQTSPKPAAITVRFTNPTASDVYVNLSFGLPWSVSDGTTVYDRPHDCTSSCSQGCSCAQCGAPAPRVRRIPAGQAIEVVWAGDYYEDKTCGSGGPGCHCDQEHTASFGSYEISMSGALGYTAGGIGGTSTDPNVLSGDIDPSAGTCVATVTAVLDATAKTVDAPFACSSP